MLIGWSPYQSSEDLRQPAFYLLDAEVRKIAGSTHVSEVRTPAPELLFGHPTVFQSALSALRLKCKYRVATLSLHRDDINVRAFNEGDEAARGQVAAAIDLFIEVAFAGVPKGARPPIMAGTHTHLDRLEVNIAMPRFVRTASGAVRSYNPHSTMHGSRNLWDALRDLLNTQYGWRSPNDGPSRSDIRGPDWAEKRLAAADRHGKRFDADREPKLFLLQTAKKIALCNATGAQNPYGPSFNDIAEELGFQISQDGEFALRLSHPDEVYVLRIRSRMPSHLREGKRVAEKTIDRLQDLWARRAQDNADRFSKSAWDEPQPDWLSRMEAPQIRLPFCHPAFETGTQGKSSATNPLWMRLRSRLSALTNALGIMIAESRILRQMAMINLAPYTSLTKKMETINHAQHDVTRRNGFADGRAVRPTPPNSGSWGGRPECGADRRTAFRAWADQDRDDASCGSLGGTAARGDGFRNYERPTGSYRAETADDGIGYRVDLSDSRAVGISRGELINRVLSAAREVFPGVPAELKLDHEYVLRLRSGRAAIAIFPDGRIVGSGDPESITQLLDALALRVPIVSVEPDLEEGCAPVW